MRESGNGTKVDKSQGGTRSLSAMISLYLDMIRVMDTNNGFGFETQKEKAFHVLKIPYLKRFILNGIIYFFIRYTLMK